MTLQLSPQLSPQQPRYFSLRKLVIGIFGIPVSITKAERSKCVPEFTAEVKGFRLTVKENKAQALYSSAFAGICAGVMHVLYSSLKEKLLYFSLGGVATALIFHWPVEDETPECYDLEIPNAKSSQFNWEAAIQHQSPVSGSGWEVKQSVLFYRPLKNVIPVDDPLIRNQIMEFWAKHGEKTVLIVPKRWIQTSDKREFKVFFQNLPKNASPLPKYINKKIVHPSKYIMQMKELKRVFAAEEFHQHKEQIQHLITGRESTLTHSS